MSEIKQYIDKILYTKFSIWYVFGSLALVITVLIWVLLQLI